MTSRCLDTELNRDVEKTSSTTNHCLDRKYDECTASTSVVAEHEEETDYVDDTATCDKKTVASSVLNDEGYGNGGDGRSE